MLSYGWLIRLVSHYVQEQEQPEVRVSIKQEAITFYSGYFFLFESYATVFMYKFYYENIRISKIKYS